MISSACPHTRLATVTIDHGGVFDAIVSCAGCGVMFLNAREAQAAGVLPRVEAARRAALDKL